MKPEHDQASLGTHAGNARLAGPFTAAGSVMRALVPEILDARPDLARRYDLEILTAAGDLSSVLQNSRETLTSRADPATRTRYYPHDRIRWIGNGLSDLVLSWARTRGGNQTLVITGADELDSSDDVWLAGLMRRADPEVLQVVLRPGSDARACTAQEYVAGACLAAGSPGEAAFQALDETARRTLHDAEADRLEALALPAARLGAVPFHRERGSRPERAVTALSMAMQTCLMAGFYPAVVDLGTRLRSLVSWADAEETRWLATVKMTIAYQAMGEPDAAMDLFDDACAHSTLPSVHMQSAYGRAMVYTRYYEEDRRDLRKARSWVNTAIVLTGLSSDAERRAYNRTFNENGLALIDMHLGNLDSAVRLIEMGIARLDHEVAEGRYLLHRSVLRYNHAQLMVRIGHLDRAVEEYTRIIEEDPNHADYYFDRAGLLQRLGREDEALRDYAEAIRVSPPYPEPHYNRGEILMRRGDVLGALKEFSRVLELEPGFVDAYVNRASLLLDFGDFGNAERDIEAGLALDPDQPHLLALLGLLHHATGRAAQAVVELERSVTLDPELASAWAALGVVLFEQGCAARAMDCLERSLALQDDPVVGENLALLRRLSPV
jgi:tetratricopeptide (TPR) repeat protein